MTAPRTLLRTAALNALAAAASLVGQNADFAPLVGARVYLGQTWPTQSPPPGAGPMPNQLLIYIWNERSETSAAKTTAPEFETTSMLVIEARVETRTPAATAALPAVPAATAIANAVDGALDALTYAVKEAVCSAIQLTAMNLNNGAPYLEGINSVEIADKLAETGQRIAGNGVVTFDLVYSETFNQLATFPPLTDLTIVVGAEAGAIANVENVGNGAVSAIALGAGAETGNYAVTLASATTFAVTAPGGIALGNGTVGTPFTGGGLTFTVNAGAVAYAAGDGFAIAVQLT
jgi:hypothetical protein